MVLYFSGTGNSQFVAIRLAEQLAEDGAVSIYPYLRTGEHAVLRSERPLVFVAPTYSWRLPRVVEQWITEAEFQGSRDAYFILTCAGSCGNAAAYAKALCKRKGLRFCGLAPVVMPENYLALFPTPGEAESRVLIERAQPRIAALADTIRNGACLAHTPVSLGDRLESGPVNTLFYRFFVHDKGFGASDRCISCGKCALRCPLSNIRLVNGRPVWQGRCTHCMACIAGCPTEAIEYKSKSKGRRRHDILDDGLNRGRGGQAR